MYTSVRSLRSLGDAAPGSNCLKLQAEYNGTYLPDSVCPEYPGQTGNIPPKPAWCGGGIQATKQALKLAGLYQGPIDDNETDPATLAAIKAASDMAGYGWPGFPDPKTVGPNQCAAVIQAAVSRAPHCAGTTPDIGCVVPPITAPSALAPTAQLFFPKLVQSLATQTTAAPASAQASVSPLLQPNLLKLFSAGHVAPSTSATNSTFPNLASLSLLRPLQQTSQTSSTSQSGASVPTWVWMAGAATVIGGAAWFALRKKGNRS